MASKCIKALILAFVSALCILWSGVMEWSLGVESKSGVLEANVGADRSA